MPGSPGKRAAQRAARQELARLFELQDEGVKDERIVKILRIPRHRRTEFLRVLEMRRECGHPSLEKLMENSRRGARRNGHKKRGTTHD